MGNQVIHVEVVGKDGAALQNFYKDVLGWSSTRTIPAATGCTARKAASPAGSGPRRTAAPDTSRSTSTPTTLRRSSGASRPRGGRVLMPLTEVAPETTVALFADPEGHVVGIM